LLRFSVFVTTGKSKLVRRRALLVFEPPDGGAAICVGQVAAGLPDHGWEVEVAGPPDATIYAALQAAGIPVRRLPFNRGYGQPHKDLAALRALTKMLRERRYSVVHCYASKAGVLGRLAGAATSTPVIYSPQCFGFVGEVGRARMIFSAVIERALGPLSRVTICACDEERRVALSHGITAAERLEVIPNGAAQPEATAPDPTLSALRGDGELVTAISVLREQKRLDVYLEAASIVLSEVPSARMAIVGNGPLAAKLRSRSATLGLEHEERFQFVPFRASAAAYLAATDIYALTSSWEAMPIGVLEAMAAGVPQVATRVGGTAEAVTPETGMLVEAGDPRAFAEATVELLRDPRRRAAMGRASRERHRRLFAVERVVRETAALYDEVACGGLLR
jgi:glycosyltransferase involved in cell wall biosynthesis